MEATKYPPLTTAALVSYSRLGPFSEVVPAEKMAELELRLYALENDNERLVDELNKLQEYSRTVDVDE